MSRPRQRRSERGGRRQAAAPPLGEPVTAEIQALSHDGRGIARLDGKATFVWGALPSETAIVQITKRGKGFDLAETQRLVTESADRVAPRCPVFGRCGGCALQHLAAPTQIVYKQQILADNLSRIGRLAEPPQRWLAPLAGSAWQYRRRARLAVAADANPVRIGFRPRVGRGVTAINHCDVLLEPLSALLQPLAEVIGRLSIRSAVPQVEAAVGEGGDSPAIALVFTVLQPSSAADDERLKQFADDYGVDIYLQSKGQRGVTPLTAAKRLWFSIDVGDQWPPLTLDFQPTDFIQINAELNDKMLAQALALLKPQPGERILDLFCGLGNFTLPLAQRCTEVVGVEGEASLVSRARQNAEQNGLSNVEFVVGDLFAPDGAPWMRQSFDAVVLDPPREGAKEILPLLPKLGAKRLLYVSCHPGTLARDAGTLVNQLGYKLVAAGVMDMFPHTAHVESITLFERA